MLGQRFRTGFGFAALLLTLVLAIALGVDAVVTGRSHRTVAEGVLRDYATLAAVRLAGNTRDGFSQRLYPLLSTAAAGGSEAPLPAIGDLIAADTALRASLGETATLVRWRAQRGLDATGAELGTADRAALLDSLPVRADRYLRQSYLMAFTLEGPTPRVVFALADRARDRPQTLYGIVLPGGAVGRLVASVNSGGGILPPSLTHDVAVDRVVTYRVRSPSGTTLSSSGVAVASPFSADRSLDSTWGNLRFEVALDPALASRLIIGGLPSSRLPLALALVTATAILIGMAWVQLARERELARQRDHFVASVSHELRTPLAQIRLFAETLRLDRVRSPEERDRSIDIIDQEARRLTHLVENLLIASRPIATSRDSRRGASVDVARTLREAVEAFEPIAAARDVVVRVTAPDRLPAAIPADAFRQIVLNLLDNAIKFGPRSATVDVTLEPGADGCELVVDDRGPGIPSGDRERVFGRFVRLDREFEAGIAGTGLGLALVRELAVAHGGTAAIAASPDGGARVSVRLPGEPA